MLYYRHRLSDPSRHEPDVVDEFESERSLLLEKFAKLEQDVAERHNLRWELGRRDRDIMELQKALSDVNATLLKEKQRVIDLCAENDNLKGFYFL